MRAGDLRKASRAAMSYMRDAGKANAKAIDDLITKSYLYSFDVDWIVQR